MKDYARKILDKKEQDQKIQRFSQDGNSDFVDFVRLIEESWKWENFPLTLAEKSGMIV